MFASQTTTKRPGWLFGATCALLLLAFGLTTPGLGGAVDARSGGGGGGRGGGGQVSMRSEGGGGSWGGRSMSFSAPRFGGGSFGYVGGPAMHSFGNAPRVGGFQGSVRPGIGAYVNGNRSFSNLGAMSGRVVSHGPVSVTGTGHAGSLGNTGRGPVTMGSVGAKAGDFGHGIGAGRLVRNPGPGENGSFGHDRDFGRFDHGHDFGRFDHDRHFGFIGDDDDFDVFFGSYWDQGFNTFTCPSFVPFEGRGFFGFNEPVAVIGSPFPLPDGFLVGPTWFDGDFVDFNWWLDHEDLDAGATVILQF